MRSIASATLAVPHQSAAQLEGGGVSGFARALRRYVEYLEVTGASERTSREYRRGVVNFFADTQVDPLLATEGELAAYVAAIPARGHKRGSATRALRSFYSWAAGRERTDNPATDLHTPRPKDRPVPNISDGDLRRLLSAAFQREPRRGWAMLLCLCTGARSGSLAGIRREHVDLPLATLYFAVAKNDDPYEIELSRPAWFAAAHLLELGHDPLLGVGAARFRQWVHEAERYAGLGRVWPHLLRHAFATRVARQTDPKTWARTMNHKDLSQYDRYVKTDRSRVREAVGAVLAGAGEDPSLSVPWLREHPTHRR